MSDLKVGLKEAQITPVANILQACIFKSVKRAIFQLTFIQKYSQIHYACAQKLKY